MKVLHVVNISFVLPYYIGDQFDYFREKGVIFYVACQPSEHFYQYAEDKKFKPIKLNILRQINVLEDIKAIYNLLVFLRKEKIDVVVGHTPKGGLIGMVAGLLAGVKQRVYFRHGVMFETSTGVKRMILKGVEKFTGMLATLVVCVSPSVRSYSNKEQLSSEHKNIILNKGTCNGIDALNKFNKVNVNNSIIEKLRSLHHISGEDRVVGFVGRLVNDKGIDELLSAWKILSATEDNIKLLLVGPIEERDAISKESIDYIKNTPDIIYIGLIEDIVPYYGIMDIFVLPSYREGFPTVVLEASAMGLPVLTTRATGCRDSILEDETGMFIKLDPMDISDKIKRYLKEPALAKLHGRQGRNFVIENFEQLEVWKEIERKIFHLNQN